jgi:hypothetical protein
MHEEKKHRARTHDGALDAMNYLITTYRRDRTEGQDWSIYLGVDSPGTYGCRPNQDQIVTATARLVTGARIPSWEVRRPHDVAAAGFGWRCSP